MTGLTKPSFLISLLVFIFFISMCKAQESQIIHKRDTSSYFPYINDSSGYQLFYAVEVYKKRNKKDDYLLNYSREGSFIKFPWERKTKKGFWFFKNYTDSIIVKDIESDNDVVVSINNDIRIIQFKNYDGSTVGKFAAAAAGAVLLGTVGMNLGAISGPEYDWSYPAAIYNPNKYAKIAIRRESDFDKKIREKVEAKLEKERQKAEKKEK